MVSFADRALLRLADPAALTALLAPVPATPPAALAMLLASTYDLESVRVDTIAAVRVTEITLAKPVFAPSTYRGTLQRTQPSWASTDVILERRQAAGPQWLDLVAGVSLDLVTEVDPGGIASVLERDLADFHTLAEFQAQFRFIDLDDFMARHHLGTVDDLREAFDYLRIEVQLAVPGPFDPADPANRSTAGVQLAVLVAPDLDLTAALRATTLARAITDDVGRGSTDPLLGPAQHPYAFAVVLSGPDLTTAGIDPTDVAALFAREQILALFLT